MKDYERMLEDYQQQVRRRLHNNEGRTMKDYRWYVDESNTDPEWTDVVDDLGYGVTALWKDPEDAQSIVDAHNAVVRALEKEIAKLQEMLKREDDEG